MVFVLSWEDYYRTVHRTAFSRVIEMDQQLRVLSALAEDRG